jgi:hypothetical protein
MLNDVGCCANSGYGRKEEKEREGEGGGGGGGVRWMVYVNVGSKFGFVWDVFDQFT